MRQLADGPQYDSGRTRSVKQRAQTIQGYLFHALLLCGSNARQLTCKVIWDINRH
jgi:hypothetical protein